MARTDLTPTATPGGHPLAKATLTLSAADTTNHNSFTNTGKEIVLVYNSDASSHNVQFTSVADAAGRQDPLNASNVAVAAGEHAIFGPFEPSYWGQTDGKVYFQADDATVKFSVIRLKA